MMSTDETYEEISDDYMNAKTRGGTAPNNNNNNMDKLTSMAEQGAMPSGMPSPKELGSDVFPTQNQAAPMISLNLVNVTNTISKTECSQRDADVDVEPATEKRDSSGARLSRLDIVGPVICLILLVITACIVWKYAFDGAGAKEKDGQDVLPDTFSSAPIELSSSDSSRTTPNYDVQSVTTENATTTQSRSSPTISSSAVKTNYTESYTDNINTSKVSSQNTNKNAGTIRTQTGHGDASRPTARARFNILISSVITEGQSEQLQTTTTVTSPAKSAPVLEEISVASWKYNYVTSTNDNTDTIRTQAKQATSNTAAAWARTKSTISSVRNKRESEQMHISRTETTVNSPTNSAPASEETSVASWKYDYVTSTNNNMDTIRTQAEQGVPQTATTWAHIKSTFSWVRNEQESEQPRTLQTTTTTVTPPAKSTPASEATSVASRKNDHVTSPEITQHSFSMRKLHQSHATSQFAREATHTSAKLTSMTTSQSQKTPESIATNPRSTAEEKSTTDDITRSGAHESHSIATHATNLPDLSSTSTASYHAGNEERLRFLEEQYGKVRELLLFLQNNTHIPKEIKQYIAEKFVITSQCHFLSKYY